MYCMHCGEQIADNSKYCKYCGKYVAENTNTNEEAASDEIKTETDSTNVTDEASAAGEVIYSAPLEEEKEVVIDDIFFKHLPKKKKIALFFLWVFMTAIVAVIVFAVFFPGLI